MVEQFLISINGLAEMPGIESRLPNQFGQKGISTNGGMFGKAPICGGRDEILGSPHHPPV